MNVAPVSRALDFGERPVPAGGIFETIGVTDGVVRLLAAHLERLRGSARELYGADVTPLPTDGPAELPAGAGRLRITFVPGHRAQIEYGPRPPDPVYDVIAPFVLPGGLGPHKWADRTLLDAITAAAGPDALPLLLDEDASVLEATGANVLIEERGRLVSPPDDGRALPGIGRSSLQYDEEPVDLARLLAADAVVLTSALRVIRVPLAT
ncbi:MAG: aminotransferase class IV [Solirubrobacteraceae bacterium]